MVLDRDTIYYFYVITSNRPVLHACMQNMTRVAMHTQRYIYLGIHDVPSDSPVIIRGEPSFVQIRMNILSYNLKPLGLPSLTARPHTC